MSGHNKWSTIKRTKEKNDAQNAKVFTKIGREIAVSVKLGGADPNSNSKLKSLILKAKACNMPNDNINRSIKKASGDEGNINYERVTYEGYGVGGSAVIVYSLTDNKNRTASEVRHTFDKFGGNLGGTGCVSYLFEQKGIIIINKDCKVSEDDMMMHVIDSGALDLNIEDEYFEIITSPEEFDEVRTYFEDKKIEIANANVDLIPTNYVNIPEDKINTFRKMIDTLEDNDDIQEVYHNVENFDCDEE